MRSKKTIILIFLGAESYMSPFLTRECLISNVMKKSKRRTKCLLGNLSSLSMYCMDRQLTNTVQQKSVHRLQ